jgi:Ca2+-binding EF-hand superfamily protein
MRKLLLGTLSAAVMSAAPLLAQDDGDLFAKLDANKDGFVSSDEVEGERKTLFERLLRTADKDGDKKLSKEEFAAGLKEPDAPREPLGQPGGRGGRGGQFINPREVFARLDANKDGKLSKEEAQGPLKENFDRFDANSDGSLSVEEASRFGGQRPGGQRPGGGAPDPQQLNALFDRTDANSDGKIAKDEMPEPHREQFGQYLERQGITTASKEQFGRFMAFVAQRGRPGEGRPGEPRPGEPRPGEPRFGDGRPPLFVALDADNDGELSSGEIEAASKSLQKLDKNGDGKLTRDELGQPSSPQGFRPGDAPGGPGQFAEQARERMMAADTNKDGKLSKEEAEKSDLRILKEGGFARFDRNGDGFIDQEEMRQFAGQRGRGGDRRRPEGDRPGDRRPEGDRPAGDRPAPPRE